jgi:hypothetical protein
MHDGFEPVEWRNPCCGDDYRLLLEVALTTNTIHELRIRIFRGARQGPSTCTPRISFAHCCGSSRNPIHSYSGIVGCAFLSCTASKMSTLLPPVPADPAKFEAE